MKNDECLSVAEYVASLCKVNNINVEQTELDRFANKITELSDDVITHDSVRDRLSCLAQHGVLSQAEAISLYGLYLNE